jgi:transcriptional repressor NrdR
VRGVRCPACGSFDDKVIDSRQADDGSSIRRRRVCIACARRFTPFERVEEAALVVTKRSGERVPFDRTKIEAGVHAAAKGRPLAGEGDGDGDGDAQSIEDLASAVEDGLRLEGRGEVTSEEIGRAVLEQLRELDPVAAVRFASVYLGFDDLSDFQREVSLLSKRTAPKRHDAGP